VAQQEGQRLLDRAPDLDLVMSPDHIATLPELVEHAREGQRTVQVGFAEVENYRFLQASEQGESGPAHGPTALVTIQKGCDNHCAYCIVPSVRGPEASRAAAEVVSEVQALVDSGVREVTLIGQNVNSYHGGEEPDPVDFVGLLTRVDAVSGLDRIRFTTSHPKDFSPELARCFATLERLCPWLHLPVQSGSSHVLELMRRGYSREHYLELMAMVREQCPDICVGTDLIVGFPGERERDFLDTVDLIERIQFDYAYSFKYSIRPGTPAEQLGDTVPEQEKARRLRHLQAVQEKITEQRLARWQGKDLKVLVQGPSRKGTAQLCGRGPGNQVVNFPAEGSDAARGDLVRLRIVKARRHSLLGEVMAP